MNDQGELELDVYKKLLSSKTKLVAVAHVSNALGTLNPIKEMIALAHGAGAKFLVDGAQSAPHMKMDVQDSDADFFVFSGHKVYWADRDWGFIWQRRAVKCNAPLSGRWRHD